MEGIKGLNLGPHVVISYKAAFCINVVDRVDNVAMQLSIESCNFERVDKLL